jgi:hypothetical protein
LRCGRLAERKSGVAHIVVSNRAERRRHLMSGVANRIPQAARRGEVAIYKSCGNASPPVARDKAAPRAALESL